MTKNKRKAGTQTDIDDLILIAENDQAFETAINETMNKKTLKKPDDIGLKELSIKLRDKEFTKKLFKL